MLYTQFANKCKIINNEIDVYIQTTNDHIWSKTSLTDVTSLFAVQPKRYRINCLILDNIAVHVPRRPREYLGFENPSWNWIDEFQLNIVCYALPFKDIRPAAQRPGGQAGAEGSGSPHPPVQSSPPSIALTW